ncbi:adenine phosphoribosyltransferase [Frigoribacterium endophyticum]|uniref:adenine phosphoribosyltransferase n=1 Tax=Frigoribacterium endophyticum TaxID=1522176 RepID=UPI0031331862|nr:adenine phosphoribosyltransferase [Frigoribacterium endophyticum]
MTDLQQRLRDSFRWRGDRTDWTSGADVTGWWRDPVVVAEIGSALAALHGADGAPGAPGAPGTHDAPTVVLGPMSRGSLLGVLTARALGVGFVEVRKDPAPLADSDAWWLTTTAPDYQDRHLTLGVRRSLLSSGDRVLFVDDWIETGAQAAASRRLVEMSGARWLGAALVVDGLRETRPRRELGVRALLHVREL